jgi:hypothetical protein
MKVLVLSVRYILKYCIRLDQRFRWSRGSVLAISTQFADSNPPEAVGF